MILSASHLSLTYPNGNGGLRALDDVSFAVNEGEFVCVVGPSGCGKSSLLKPLSGLRTPTTGEVIFEGEMVHATPEKIALVFQKANLMPWRTVFDNITLPLELKNLPAHKKESRAREMIDLVGLGGFESAYPRELSGGMEQRVAIARALVQYPDVLLLDEPFGSLDALTRERMSLELLRIWDRYGKTVIMVTHSISEAVFLADRVLVFTPRPGSLRAEIKVNLPRPRNLEMTYSKEFGEIASRVRVEIGD
ncbi:MAG: ABC transporter ATP-binding protein [Chloroflexi bacterium]|nr:ABC transporter ATP-binding protein [Chloroflexota bacterium]